jgi:hypothetical protein
MLSLRERRRQKSQREYHQKSWIEKLCKIVISHRVSHAINADQPDQSTCVLFLRVPANSLVTYSPSGWLLCKCDCIGGGTSWGSALKAAIPASHVSHHHIFRMNPPLVMQWEQHTDNAPWMVQIFSLVCWEDICTIWGGLDGLQSRMKP